MAEQKQFYDENDCIVKEDCPDQKEPAYLASASIGDALNSNGHNPMIF